MTGAITAVGFPSNPARMSPMRTGGLAARPMDLPQNRAIAAFMRNVGNPPARHASGMQEWHLDDQDNELDFPVAGQQFRLSFTRAVAVLVFLGAGWLAAQPNL